MSQIDNCVSCGMPMRSAEEHAIGDMSKDYCVKCALPDGSMKSYQQVRAGLGRFLHVTQGIDETVAGQTAGAMLARQPAWSDR